jgi:hypothetical protein
MAGMSLDLGSRLGLAGVALALFSIAAFYLWPDKKWIGWVCLVAAALLLLVWGVEEAKQVFSGRTSLAISIAIGCVLGGGIGAIAWKSIPRESKQDKQGLASAAHTPSLESGSPASPKAASVTTEAEKEIISRLDDLKRKMSVANPGSPESQRPFLISSGAIFVGNSPTNGGFAVVPLAAFMSSRPDHPFTIDSINLMVFVGVLNQQSAPTIIEGYKLELRKENGKWIPLDRVASVLTGKVCMSLGNNRMRLIDTNPFFDRVIADRVVKPGDYILGWMVFKYPPSVGTFDANTVRLRLTVYAPDGRKTKQELDKNTYNTVAQSATLTYGPVIDLVPHPKQQ